MFEGLRICIYPWVLKLNICFPHYINSKAAAKSLPVSHPSVDIMVPLSQYRDQTCFFHALTFARTRWSCWKPRPKANFQQFPRDLANVNALENNVWSLLLHKFNHNTKKITKIAEHYFRPHRKLLIPTRTIQFYKNRRFRPLSSIVIFFQPLAEFRKFKSFSLTFSLALSFCTISESA